MSIHRDQQLERIIAWANSREDIRAVLLTSSLINPDAPSDIFSDLDIELVVTDLPILLSNDDWLGHFGQVLSKIVENEAAFDGKHAMRMVLYEDYTKVDFKLWSVDHFLQEVNSHELPEDWDVGYKVLLDKEGLTSRMQQPTYRSVIIKKPTEKEFNRVFNDYWWDTSYVAKCLWRDNIFYTKFMTEHEIRFQYLQPMIEWYIASTHGWQVTTNKFGRLFRQYLSPAMWAKVERTFSGSNIEENWKALFATNELVREIGLYLAGHLHYTYPMELDQKMTQYQLVVKNLPKEADRIA